MKKTTAPVKRSGAGRPLKDSEPMKSRTFRTTDAQWEKVERLGGGTWLRKTIDSAKE